MLPEDLEAADFFEDPLLDFFAEDLPPFLDFWTWAGTPPPPPEKTGATAIVGGFGARVSNESVETVFSVPYLRPNLLKRQRK